MAVAKALLSGALVAAEIFGAAGCSGKNDRPEPIGTCLSAPATPSERSSKTSLQLRRNAEGGVVGNQAISLELAAKIFQSVVKIEFDTADSTFAAGTGVVVEGGVVLTADHYMRRTDGGQPDTSHITIVTGAGRVGVKKVCRIMDAGRQQVADLPTEGLPDADIVAMIPEEPVGVPVPVATESLGAGQWLVAGTIGTDSTPFSINPFGAVALSRRSNPAHVEPVLAGLGGPNGNDPNTEFLPGNSGAGLFIVGETGELQLACVHLGHAEDSSAALLQEYGLSNTQGVQLGICTSGAIAEQARLAILQ